MDDRTLYSLLDQLDEAIGIMLCDLDGGDFRAALERTNDVLNARHAALLAAERGWFVMYPRPPIGHTWTGPYATYQEAFVGALTTLWQTNQRLRAML
jgi:hypothetical protein